MEISSQKVSLLKDETSNSSASSGIVGGDSIKIDIDHQGLGRRQLNAMLRKNFLLKRRNWIQLFFELTTPVLMLSLLLIGYNLSDISTAPAKICANDTLFPYSPRRNPVDELLHILRSFKGPVPTPPLDLFILTHDAIRIALGNSSQHSDTFAHLSEDRFNNLLYLGDLCFAPAISEPLVIELNKSYPLFHTIPFRIFATEKDAIKYAMRKNRTNQYDRTWAVVLINQLDLERGHIDYTIRMNYTTLPYTKQIIHRFGLGLNTEYQRYIYSGFLSLQEAIDSIILQLATNKSSTSPLPHYSLPFPSLLSFSPLLLPLSISNLSSYYFNILKSSRYPPYPPRANFVSVPFPVVGYKKNQFYDAVGPLVGFLMCMSTLYPVSRLIKGIVEEKETKKKETMKIMGLKDWVFYLSWFLTYFGVFTMIAFSVSIMLGLTIFPRSDLSLLMLFFFLFTCSEIMFSFLVSTLFNRAKLAGIIGPVVLFASVLPRYAFFRSGQDASPRAKKACSVLSPTAFALGGDLITQYEGSNMGLTWDHIHDDAYSFATVLWALGLDCILYALLAWYAENVLPNQYGLQKPLCFCFHICWKKKNTTSEKIQLQNVNKPLVDAEDETIREPVAQKITDSKSVCVNRLRKVYTQGNKVAVRGLSLNMYQGQITSLLGHNGAGKTTTISMLTGLIQPTKGDALISGLSIRRDMSSIRQSLGVCPQHNVLFDTLTCSEHLELYCVLKGVAPHQIKECVIQKIKEVGLIEKQHVFADALSGGQKRKLQCAIALIGGSKVVFLDEPTSGMDPYSRRATWNLLQRSKTNRTIILTTHFMDEADLLGDRIAIMAKGKLVCVGSSLFLKTRYGTGYTLTMVKAHSQCETKTVADMVKRHIPNAQSLSSAGGEMAYRLPLSSVGNFCDLFKELEEKRENIGIGGYGISITTLEEVFLRLTREEGIDSIDKKHNDEIMPNIETKHNQISTQPPQGKSTNMAGYSINSPSQHSRNSLVRNSSNSMISDYSPGSTFPYQLQILLSKRLLCSKRDLKGRFFEVLLPVCLVALVLLILKLNVDPAGPSLNLDSSLYGKPSSEVLYTQAMDPALLKALRNDKSLLLHENNATSSLGLSLYLLKTALQHSDAPRYGAFASNDTINYRLKYQGKIYSFPWDSRLTVLHNASSSHALPVFVTTLTQSLFRKVTNNPAAQYIVRNHPLPISDRTALIIETFLTVFAAIFVLIPFCYLPATFSIFIVKERTVKAKHLQLVSGTSINAYWISNYIWDALNYIFISACVMFVFWAYKSKEFAGKSAPGTYSILLLYGLSVIPLSYCYSFLFSNHTSAQIGITGLHFIAGFVFVMASFIMGAIESTKSTNDVLIWIYRLFPPFNFGEGLIQLSSLSFINMVTDPPKSPFAWDVTGRNLMFLAVEIPVYFLLALLIDHGILPSLYLRIFGSWLAKVPDPAFLKVVDDIDVLAEAKRVDSGAADNEIVCIKQLRKVWPARGGGGAKVAVRNISIGIPRGEIFGFLGINGAGKTSTMMMLTGDVLPTMGNAYINGHSILDDISQVRKCIGYCPQFDPLLDLMTGRETLTMYAKLRGLKQSIISGTVQYTLSKLGLDMYADRICGSYSGGNKRKLSLGIALIGHPSVMFLDEPTTGMDPGARRMVWDIITDTAREKKISVILTTHSMEECEALCSRTTIMVNGAFQCLGSSQHLKSRFGEGYWLEIKVSAGIQIDNQYQNMLNLLDERMKTVQNFISSDLPAAQLREHHSNQLKYAIPQQNVSLSSLFSLLQTNREALHIQDFSVSQGTLEQIFVRMAKNQLEDDRIEE